MKAPHLPYFGASALTILVASLIFQSNNNQQSPSSSSTPLFANANPQEEVLCTINPDTNTEECEAVYFEPEVYESAIANADEVDEEMLDKLWRAQLAPNECRDNHPDCPSYATKGECITNPGFMTYECAKSCNTCAEFEQAYYDLREGNGDGPCTDRYRECKNWAAMGECAVNPSFMLDQCERSCFQCYVDTNQFGMHQKLPHEEDKLYSQTQEIIEATTTYMKKMWSDPQYKRVNYKCRNMHEDCAYWVATGECEANPTYMQTNCAPSCQTCESLDIRLRCPILPENELVLKPGGLNELMERIVDNSDGKGEYLKYNPKAASRPKLKKDGTESGVDVDGPWIVVFENFVSDEEATALIEAGAKKGYERSADVGIENPDGSHEDDVNDDRTSHNAWCDDELCNNDPVIAPVIERIATVTKTSVNNSEFLQLLQYEPGQYYKQHHDYIEYQGTRMVDLSVRYERFYVHLS